jgi:hypothetical protein
VGITEVDQRGFRGSVDLDDAPEVGFGDELDGRTQSFNTIGRFRGRSSGTMSRVDEHAIASSPTTVRAGIRGELR